MIQITAWDRDAEDYNGKTHAEVFYVFINGTKERAVGRADLLRMVKMTLPERSAQDDEPIPAESPAMANGN